MNLSILLILFPMVMGFSALFIRSLRTLRHMLIAGAAAQLLALAPLWFSLTNQGYTAWFYFDYAGLIVASIAAIMFTLVAVYLRYFLKFEAEESARSNHKRMRPALFGACFFFFLSAVTMLCAAQHVGVFWAALELTTFATAPMIYYYRQEKALEATLKYLLICSVGIGLALIGNLFLALATPPGIPLTYAELSQNIGSVNTPWLCAAFLFFLIGFGTKMGLVPLHTWLPEAHSESPAPLSALLSGVLLNGAFLGIFRQYHLLERADATHFALAPLLTFGLLSLFVASVFIIVQKDFKRMLAYSSIEHMGVLALGLSLGPIGYPILFFHMINHSFSKGILFLCAGNIYNKTHTRAITSIHNLRKLLPVSGTLWIVGLFSISGFPPGGLFLSEFAFVYTFFKTGRVWEGALLLLGLFLVFSGMSKHMICMLLRGPNALESEPVSEREDPFSYYPIFVLIALTVALGCYLPDFLQYGITHLFER